MLLFGSYPWEVRSFLKEDGGGVDPARGEVIGRIEKSGGVNTVVRM